MLRGERVEKIRREGERGKARGVRRRGNGGEVINRKGKRRRE